MNAHSSIPYRIPTDNEPGPEEWAMRGDYTARARRIVERVLPHLPANNPLHDPHGFRAASIRHGERERLFWRTFARLRAKAEGGMPYLTLPTGHDGFGHMAQVARELKRNLDDASLRALSKGQRRYVRDGL